MKTRGEWWRRSLVVLASIFGGLVGFVLGTVLGVYTGGCYQDGWWKSSCTGRLIGLEIVGVTTAAVVLGLTASRITRRHATRDGTGQPN